MKPRSLIVLGLAVFVLTALLHVPAVQLQRLGTSALAASGITLSGLEGTLSAGRAARVDLRGHPLLHDLGWTLRRAQLLLGRASFRLEGGRDGTRLDGVAFVVPSGAVQLRDFRFASPLVAVLAAAGYPFVPVEGQALFDFERLVLRERWPEQAHGRVTLRGLSWKLGREPLRFGDYEARVEDETAGIKLTVGTLSGVLEVRGDGRVGHDHEYELHLQMRPRPDAPPTLPNLLRNLGQPDAQGWYHLRQRGTLPRGAPPAPIAPTA